MITDHTFRPSPPGGDPEGRGRRGGSNVALGRCNWLGTCGGVQDDHITVPDYRAWRDNISTLVLDHERQQ